MATGEAGGMKPPPDPHYRHRFPLISHAVWLYRVFSLRDVELLLAERGVVASYKTVRRWCKKFAASFADRMRRRPQPGGCARDRLNAATDAGPLPGRPVRFPVVAARKPQIVRARLSSPAFAFATVRWKYPSGVVRKAIQSGD